LLNERQVLVALFEWESKNNFFALVENSVHPSDALDGSDLVDQTRESIVHIWIEAKSVLQHLIWNASAIRKLNSCLHF
jgi:hypothetical protein